MPRWEYKVVSMRDGSYTATLNEYGREGWELVSVTAQSQEPPVEDKGTRLPMPRSLGRLEDAAAKLNKLGAADPADAAAGAASVLVWLRRPLPENRPDDAFELGFDS